MHTDSPAAPPLAALPQGALRLDDWGVIRATGADAAAFLHGQLTQDMLHLEAGHARLAGYCSAKGRLLATFAVWRSGPEHILLACSADLLPAMLKKLSTFVLRARCQLVDASAEWPLWGLAGDDAAAAASGDTWACQTRGATTRLRLPDAVVAGRVLPRALWAGAPAPAAPALDAQAWRWLEVHSGVARISAATSEHFVPQMVNLEVVGGVNFQKGCYPGQEVVARSQYRGSLKRRSQIVQAPLPLQPGQEVFHSADPAQPAGEVVLAGGWGGQHAALVELKLSALDAGTLHAGAADGPLLRPEGLPYALPTEAG